jgi:hypothetical protein
MHDRAARDDSAVEFEIQQEVPLVEMGVNNRRAIVTPKFFR